MSYSGYINGFQVARLDEFGRRILLANTTLNISTVPSGTPTPSTVTTDDDGLVPNMAITVTTGSEGTQVQFSHSGDPLTLRRGVYDTAEEAAAAPENVELAFIVENLYAETAQPDMLEVWRQSLSDPDALPEKVGYAPVVTGDNVFPFETVTTGDWRYYVQPMTRDGRRAFVRFTDAALRDFTPVSSVPESYGDQSANTIFAGPTTGSPAPPGFRSLVPADIPNLSSVYQPLDATLTALAAQNWTANAIPIGTGADTLSQVSFAANTFPARASSGNLVAKTITDFGLSLVDDSNAAAARTTLGGSTVGQNVFTLTDPSAAGYIRVNADNSVTYRSFSNVSADLGLGTMATQNASSVAITGGTIAGVAITNSSGYFLSGTFSLSDDGDNHHLFINWDDFDSANRSLNIQMAAGDRTLHLGGDLTLGGTLTTAAAASLPAIAQGDLWYGSASGAITALAKSTAATRYLANTGTSNNPKWDQINLANGVTGDLPFANLAQINGLSLLGVTGTSLGDVAAITSATPDSVMVSNSAGTAIGWGAVKLSSSDAVTGTLGPTNGGTGLSTATLGDIIYASASNTWAKLAKSTSTGYFLSNSGSSNIPAWANPLTIGNPVASGGANRLLFEDGSQNLAASTDMTYASNLLTLNGGISLTGSGGANRTINYGANFGNPALTLYDGGTGSRWGWGIVASNMQFFGPSSGTNHISFNKGGDLQSSGTNEVFAVDFNTGYVTGGGSNDFKLNCNLNMIPSGGGTVRNISWGTSFGTPALLLYDGGAGSRWGWGIVSSEMQFFGPSSGTNHISFNKGGDLQTSGTNEVMRVDLINNSLKIGGSATRGTTESTNAVVLFNGTAPVGTLSNGASLYVTSGEMRVMDSAGNATLLSPHDEEGNYIHDEINFKGRRLRIDMERMLKDLDKMLGGGYITESFEKPPRRKRTKKENQ